MTMKYERPRPESFRADPPEAAHMHSSHAVLQDSDYTSPQQAKEDALDLAAELGISDELCVDAFSLPFRHRTSTKSVLFCEEVQVLSESGDASDPGYQVFQHDELRQWKAKPWRLTHSSSSSTTALRKKAQELLTDRYLLVQQDRKPTCLSQLYLFGITISELFWMKRAQLTKTKMTLLSTFLRILHRSSIPPFS